MSQTVTVLAPVANNHSPPRPVAPRPPRLQGLRPAVLENSKPNAQALMEFMVEGLSRRHGMAPVLVTHKGVTLPPSQATVARLRENADFVLVGTGDCGSCTAWTVRGAAVLEEAGVPTVSIGTHEFAAQFREEADRIGMPDLAYVSVEHPLGGVKEPGVFARAEEALDRLEAQVLGTGA